MAAAAASRRTMTLGGKGSSLTSSSVFQISNGFARVGIDSSALSRCSSSSSSNSAATFSFSIPSYFTAEEARASVILLLNKLLLSSSSSTCAQLVEILEREVLGSDHTLNDVASADLPLLDYSAAAVAGVAAILDHRSAALASIVDAVAALSCEALRVDVSPFNLTDSGDGSSAKDAVDVAADFKEFFKGSKLINLGKKLLDASVAEIPSIHGDFRDVCRILHSRARVQLNSGFGAGSTKVLSTALEVLASSLSNLGENSLRRIDLLVSTSISDVKLRCRLSETLPAESLCAALEEVNSSSRAALLKKDYLLFVHKVYDLLNVVRNVVSWEATAAFISLGGSEIFVDKIDNGSLSEPSIGDNLKSFVNEIENGSLSEPSTGDNPEIFVDRIDNGSSSKPSIRDNPKTDKKNEKKRKVEMGNGTNTLMQFIKDRFLGGAAKYDLEKCTEDFQSLLNPEGPDFDDLVMKVKEIVETNGSRRLPKLPKGTRDFCLSHVQGTRDFAEKKMAVREKAFAIITEVFKRHGAMALDTPVFELRETLMGKYGEDSKLIYDLANQGGELCSLRYDLTVPFARYVATNKLSSFKRYQIAKVYRRDNPSKGRYREFYQCDFDSACTDQSEKMLSDFEVLKILTELLDELAIGDYEVKLNHRKLLDGVLAVCGVPQEKFRTICSSIDKLDKQTFEQIKRELAGEKGLTEKTADKIGSYVKRRGSPMELLTELKEECIELLSNSEAELALNELEILFNALLKSKCINRVVFDLSLARGLDYYTGVIFEAVFKGSAQVGSIAAGGCYDNLIEMFGKNPVPAVGVSLGIERVFDIMEQLQNHQAIRATETQVLVSILGDDISLGAELASELWDAKLKAEVMVNKSIDKLIKRATRSEIPFMAIVGKRELSKGVVKLKDITARTEDEVLRDGLVVELQRRLNISS